MTVAVAYAPSATGRLALETGIEEARLRGENLVVVHVLGVTDADKEDAYRERISSDIEHAVGVEGSVPWRLQQETAASAGDVADLLVGLVEKVGARRVVVGARRRSPVGKALLGSTAQSLVLGVSAPVVVVKPTS